MEVQLRRLGPVAKVKTLRVPNGCETKMWLAGRGTCCQIYTKSKYASRQHFSITYRDHRYFISDLQSANGTFINDEQLTSEKILTFGNIISVGCPSEMQRSPDCVVYAFESKSNIPLTSLTTKASNSTHPEVNISSVEQAVPELQSTENNTEPQDTQEEVCNEPLDVEMHNDIEKTIDESSSSDIIFIEPPIRVENPTSESDEPVIGPKPAKIPKLDDCFLSNQTDKNEEKSEDIIVKNEESDKNEENPEGVVKNEESDKNEENPEGVVKNEESDKNEEKSEDIIVKNEESDKNEEKPGVVKNEDMLAYEALTQTDEPHVKIEPDLLNYSQTEELIEISDSEDDWSPGVKLEEIKSELLDEDDDDDVIILETIIWEPKGKELPPINYKVEYDDMTETDKKWLGKLLKVKTEGVSGSEGEMQNGKLDKKTEVTHIEVDEPEVVEVQEEISTKVDKFSVIPCTIRLARLSTNDLPDEVSEPAVDVLPSVKMPKKILKRVKTKKSVSFDMVPQIKYFEVPIKIRLTPSEKGRLRFNKVIFNICNWNTHWLEECKKVAADKVPLDICEERLRKIPKRFPNHSDYMVAFIPAMLLHLWNKIKENWVTSGESGFRQTVSCDSCEDYHTEHVSVYNCTGLVQSVSAHKQLIREGHLVLLRLHQTQVPQFTTPATEKYSKKLGYLVFGFVERKIYERYHNQALHQGLSERCSSILGDLHIVRLRILVKKRPSFQLDKQKLIQITVVQQIFQEIRMFKGICLLPDSPLCSVILKPTKNEGPLPESPKTDLVFKGPLDDLQSEIVRNLSHACLYTRSLLYNIHGASGTGKSQVVAALILQLLYGIEWKCKRPKILYCTQWSVPLDEMVKKLNTLRQNFEEPFKLVRIGPVREVKPEVRDLCVSTLASNMRNSNTRVTDSRIFDAEAEIIKEADVLCSTCVSAGTIKVCAAFEKLLMKDRDRKIICIIDEAMSCKETDSVIPLQLGVTHLILAGDIYQMEPTFSGEKTHSLGLDMSLFWRIYKNFMNIPKELWPISILKTQYRMNSSLSKFTSQLIYKTSLKTPSESVSKKIPKIRSHLLLLDKTPESVTGEERENREVRIVHQLVKAVVKLTKSVTSIAIRLGVIVSNTKQIESLRSLLPKKEYPEVDIDHIQAFQGRELDIVIFVHDGRKIVTSWLATALTRAKRSLFIFSSERSINENALLRKVASSAGEQNFLKYVHPDMTLLDFEQVIV